MKFSKMISGAFRFLTLAVVLITVLLFAYEDISPATPLRSYEKLCEKVSHTTAFTSCQLTFKKDLPKERPGNNSTNQKLCSVLSQYRLCLIAAAKVHCDQIEDHRVGFVNSVLEQAMSQLGWTVEQGKQICPMITATSHGCPHPSKNFLRNFAVVSFSSIGISMLLFIIYFYFYKCFCEGAAATGIGNADEEVLMATFAGPNFEQQEVVTESE